MKTAFIFPAFVTEYLGLELDILEALSAHFNQYLAKASEITGEDYNSFSPGNPVFIEHELRNQVISYTFGCCLSDALAAKNLTPDLMAGYSMGLYAALYAGKAISFEDGIRLIEQAFLISQKAVEGVRAGMGAVIGLTADEINTLITAHQLEVDIANKNSQHAHLVSGPLDDLKELLVLSEEEGALHVTRLLVETPYHSPLLKDTKDEFGKFVSEKIHIKDSMCPIISAIDQRNITSIAGIKEELVHNLYSPLDWHTTFKTLLQSGMRQFIECGAGKNLTNISRFIPGDFKIYSINKILRLLAVRG